MDINAFSCTYITLEGLASLLQNQIYNATPSQWLGYRASEVLYRIGKIVTQIREYIRTNPGFDPMTRSALDRIAATVDGLFGSTTQGEGFESLLESDIEVCIEEIKKLLADSNNNIQEIDLFRAPNWLANQLNGMPGAAGVPRDDHVQDIVLRDYINRIANLINMNLGYYNVLHNKLLQGYQQGLRVRDRNSWVSEEERRNFNSFAREIDLFLDALHQFGEGMKVVSEDLKFALNGRDRPNRG